MANGFPSGAGDGLSPATAGARRPALSDGHIAVWRVSVTAWRERLPECRALLSADEVRRIDRLAFARDRAVRAVARASLRCILARYLSLHPDRLELVETAYGKPVLGGGAPPLRFNTSHSGDVVLHAVARDRQVGIDVEAVRRDEPVDMALARMVFSTLEVDHLARLPPEQRPDAFHRIWTAKEAYVKALGLGLSHCLQDFSVVGRGLADGRILDGTTGRPLAGWQLHALAVGEGYAACLAWDGPSAEVIVRPCLPHTLDHGRCPPT